MSYSIIFVVYFFLMITPSYADIINPSLLEISIYPDNTVEVNIRTNIEAILSDSSLYQNSKDSPNTKQYDELRALPPSAVEQLFLAHLPIFLTNISLNFDSKKIPLKLNSLKVPDIGYQGRERVSIIKLSAKLEILPQILSWHYPRKYGDSAYRYRFYEADKYTWQPWSWLRDIDNSGNIALSSPKYPSSSEILAQYSAIGYSHILPKGLDHILFILGIALLSLTWRRLLLIVTIFTIAHSLTLALAIYNIITVPAQIVEPLIAISIAYIGLEVLFNRNAYKFETIVVFIFGLLHGLGFASVLAQFDMLQNSLALSLLGFNIGVELGQITIILTVITILYLFKKTHFSSRKYLIQPMAIAIAVIGFVWTVERIMISL